MNRRWWWWCGEGQHPPTEHACCRAARIVNRGGTDGTHVHLMSASPRRWGSKRSPHSFTVKVNASCAWRRRDIADDPSLHSLALSSFPPSACDGNAWPHGSRSSQQKTENHRHGFLLSRLTHSFRYALFLASKLAPCFPLRHIVDDRLTHGSFGRCAWKIS